MRIISAFCIVTKSSDHRLLNAFFRNQGFSYPALPPIPANCLNVENIKNKNFLTHQQPSVTHSSITAWLAVYLIPIFYCFKWRTGLLMKYFCSVNSFQIGVWAAGETTRITADSAVRGSRAGGAISASSTWRGICFTSAVSRTSFAARYVTRTIAGETCSRDTWYFSTTSMTSRWYRNHRCN